MKLKLKKSLLLSEQRAKISFLVLVYIFLIHLVFVDKITTVYGYMGYKYYGIDIFESALIVFFSIFPVYFMRIFDESPSAFSVILIYAIVYLPTQYMMSAIDPMIQGQILYRFTLMAALFILTYVSSKTIYISGYKKISKGVFRILMTILYSLLFLVVLSQFGFTINLISFGEVYDVRSEYKTSLQKSSTLVIYAISFLSIISAFLVGYALKHRNWIFGSMGILAIVYLFGMTGHKSMLFSSLLMIGLVLMYRGVDSSQKYVRRLVSYLCALITLSWIIDEITGGLMFTSLFTRRMIVTPGLLTNYYFEFFSINPPAQLAHSFLGSIFTYPYDVNPAFIIGKQYFNSETMSANANIFADAFANFRLIGILVFSGIFGVILAFIDGYSQKLKDSVGVIMGLALPFFSLTNSALFTTLLTHGLLFAVVLTYLYVSSEDNKIGEKKSEGFASDDSSPK